MNRTSADSIGYSVPALRRGAAILNLFSPGRPVISVAEIADELAIPRATAFRLVATMVQESFLVRERNVPRVRLGPMALRLGLTYLHSQDFIEKARPHLHWLHDRFSAGTHLAIKDGRFAVYVLRTPSAKQTGDWSRIGHRLPIHASACGRCLLFDHTRNRIEALYGETPFEIFSNQTPRNIDELMSTLEIERKKGYVSYHSGVAREVSACAAPVRDHSGDIIAAISVADIQTIPSLADLDGEVKDVVVSMCRRFSEELGYAYPPHRRPRKKQA